ncbi:histidine kinase [Pseudomaricurvus sp.]|uniref:histidine kinase n=1 Tax=Pseudomaricurvus sp. TaxID=2004510 RepID=UPI003F6A65E1
MSTESERSFLHEIRNQLNNISMNTELAKLQANQGQPAEAIVESLNKVSEACKECSQLIEKHD